MRFRFIDRVVSFEKGEASKLVTVKKFLPSDDFYEGHPQRPGEVPNCLIIESLVTAGSRLVYSHSGEAAVGILARIDEAKMFPPVFVGDELWVETELIEFQAQLHELMGLAKAYGRARVGGRCVAEARFVLFCFPQNGLEKSIPW